MTVMSLVKRMSSASAVSGALASSRTIFGLYVTGIGPVELVRERGGDQDVACDGQKLAIGNRLCAREAGDACRSRRYGV